MLFHQSLPVFLLASCHHAWGAPEPLGHRGASAEPNSQLNARQVAINTFDYTPTNGPLTWFTLPNSQLCKQGRFQSPILLDSSIGRTTTGALNLRVTNSVGKLENKGTAIEVVDVEGSLMYEGRTYKLVNFHFHTPSEHRINKEHYPVEMHMVHQNASGGTAVLGFVIQLSTTRYSALPYVALRKVSQIAPGQTITTDQLNFAEIIEYVRTKLFYRYGGSLTTPPCSEGLLWFVGPDPLYLDVGTYNALKAAVKFNSRIIQNAPGKPNVIEVACNGGP
jgi:carbonic anhydrase